MESCPFCAAVRAHRSTPAVAVALDRLRDEVTVSMLATTSTVPVAAGSRVRDYKRARSIRKKPFQRALEALAFGPLPIGLLVEDVYGPPVDDAEEMELRRQRVAQMLRNQIRLGRVERVGWGVYALAGRADGMRRRTASDCREILADPNVQPAGGLTVAEIADRFDVSVELVHRWIYRLRREGVPIVSRRDPPRPGRGSPPARYSVAQEVA